MKKYFAIIICLTIFCTCLYGFSSPILTNVNIQIDSLQVRITYDISNFQEGISVDLNIFDKGNKNIISPDEDSICGDVGKISKKDSYEIVVKTDDLPADFTITEYVIFPQMMFEGRIYYEMLKIEKGKHLAVNEEGVSHKLKTQEFYISKFEVSNQQFAQFIKNDGYETYEYWKVREGLMRNTEVGWFFQGQYNYSSPRKWDLTCNEYWEKAPSNFAFGPVTMMSWFEANAFCHWMGGFLPELSQMQICFAKESYEDSLSLNPVCFVLSDNDEYQMHFIQSNVGEWVINPPDTRASECGPGCKEMFYLLNDDNNFSDYPVVGMSCPLFCNENLGFRLVIIPKD